jgi:NADH-quinone oxidoreductase subunit N
VGSLIALTIFGIINLFLGFSAGRSTLLLTTIIGLLVAMVFVITGYELPAHLVGGMLQETDQSKIFSLIILGGAIFVLPIGHYFTRREGAQTAEYYAIMLFSLVGALMLTTFENMIMLFVGVETLSISMYILAGSDKRNVKSNEAALKYFLMGAFATGILLFGIALLYGATGSFFISDFNNYLSQTDFPSAVMAYTGLFLVMGGLLFKVGAAPFHFWTPDVYEGTPSFFTAYMATVVKTATVAALYKMFVISFAPGAEHWWYTMYYVVIATLLIGNMAAVAQSSFKRMMAYSSISHAGYMLMAVLALNGAAFKSLAFYAVIYTLASVVAFAVLIVVTQVRENDNFISFNGLAKSNPALAVLLTIAMISMAGIPLTAGFFGKFFIFSAVLSKGYLWILVIAILMSAVGVFYYFRVIINMFFKVGEGMEKISLPVPLAISLYGSSLLILILGVYPDLLMQYL